MKHILVCAVVAFLALISASCMVRELGRPNAAAGAQTESSLNKQLSEIKTVEDSLKTPQVLVREEVEAEEYDPVVGHLHRPAILTKPGSVVLLTDIEATSQARRRQAFERVWIEGAPALEQPTGLHSVGREDLAATGILVLLKNNDRSTAIAMQWPAQTVTAAALNHYIGNDSWLAVRAAAGKPWHREDLWWRECAVTEFTDWRERRILYLYAFVVEENGNPVAYCRRVAAVKG